MAQNIVAHYTMDSIAYYKLEPQMNKIIPEKFLNVILIALNNYPELQSCKIAFRYKKSKSPLSAKISFSSLLQKAKNRQYVITISKKSKKYLQNIILDSLSFNAQIGVIGHELAHIAYFNSLNAWQFLLYTVKLISTKNTDKNEFATDAKCIEHGLGYQLLSWSIEVRQKLKIKKWGGANNPNAAKERYMNPETIIKKMRDQIVYKAMRK